MFMPEAESKRIIDGLFEQEESGFKGGLLGRVFKRPKKVYKLSSFSFLEEHCQWLKDLPFLAINGVISGYSVGEIESGYWKELEKEGL